MKLLRSISVTLGLDPRARGAVAPSSETVCGLAAERPVLGSSPTVTAVGVFAALSLAACGQAAEKTAPTPAEKVSAVTPASGVEASVPVVVTAANLRRVCRAGLAAIHGQGVQDIQIDGIEGKVVNASWRAPVDGGRRRAQCRVDGDIVTWKPVGVTIPEQDRWMNQSGDPVARFALDGDAITINTTLPDGTTATETHSVAAEQEAR